MRSPLVEIGTKSIYDPQSGDDGLRLLVTRYWPRGVKKERTGAWIRELGPSAGLIRRWKAAEISWEEFSRSYLEEFGGRAKQEALEEALSLLRGSGEKRATLLCTCRDGSRCHRAILRGIIEKRLRGG